MASTSRVQTNWERLVSSALLKAELRGSSNEVRPESTSGIVPTSLGSNIDSILQAADEVEGELPDGPHVSRILCEYAYSLAQRLDPKSAGRGVLQFKTGLKSIIKQKQSRKEGERLDRSLDIELLQRFYAFYRKKHNVEQLQSTTNMGLGETEKVRRVFATLRVLRDVLAELTRNMEGIPGQLKAVMDSDAAKVFKPYNILPLEVPGAADARMNFPEVRAAILELKYTAELPQLPESFAKPTQRPLDIFDLLHFVFGFQADNVNNQREHLLLLLSNRQARLGGLQDNNSPLDEKAINENYQRFLQNYERWCTYVRKQSVCSRFPPTRQMKLILVALYMLIWGEAANLRFLPECLCYIFHKMAENLFEILRTKVAERGKNWKECENPFLEHVVLPVYQVIAAEAENNDDGKAPHAVWRNYDDFNEYFWSSTCFQLDWPWRLDADFFLRPRRKKKAATAADSELPIRYRKSQFGGKVFFVEHRTFVHGYHSFHRLWMFLLMMLQGLTIVAFTKNFHLPSIKKILSLGPTYVIMKFFQSFLDVMLMYGAYATTNKAAVTRICFRFVWLGACSGLLTYLYIKVLEEPSAGISDSTYFQIYILVLVIYAVYRIFLSVLLRLPAFYRLTDKCGNGGLIRFIKWIQQERFFVGRGLYESSFDYLSYVFFWVLVLGAKFTFSYFMQIKPLVTPTKLIINFRNIKYAWHDIVSQGNHNALTVAFIWAPVMLIYFLDLQIWYTIVSALYGGLNGARSRLGEIRSLGMIRKRFDTFPPAFVHKMVPSKGHGQVGGRSKIKDTTNEQLQAIQFAPFWNELIHNLRAEDYISNKECELLLMPSNLGKINLVQWPLFLLANKVYLAIDIAKEANLNQTDLWDRMQREEYMRPAIVEIYYSVQDMLIRLVQSSRAPREWVNHVFNYIRDSIHSSSFVAQFQMDHLSDVLVKVTKLAELLYHEESPDRIKSVVKALEDLYETVMHDFLSLELRENIEAWEFLDKAKQEGKLFDERINWPSPEERLGIKRLYSLLSIKDSALSIPRNLEARRRLNFFTNSLFMKMPEAPPVQKMLSFSVFTPYYSEDVLYTKDQLRLENEDGITILFYLQKIFPDEWKNFLERIGLTETALMLQLKDDKMDLIELRLWASYRGQTLARTVRGMMYYHKALMLQSFLEKIGMSDVENALSYEDFREYKTDIDASAQAALKFTYVVSCQIYGQQKQKKETKATDINYLLQKNEALRVAYIDVVEKVDSNGKVHKEFYSKLIKADTTGKDQEIYSVKLPGNPKIGEGKPENQNHAIIFTRGDAIQTIDMNQDNYFEEAFKMRNLLEEFDIKHGIRKPTILGVREHVFTGSVSSLAWFMSNQESSFVTLGQRVLANPLKVRMHYGHPDVFDRVFHITRGGISKASRVINISEDIFAGFNSTLRQGNITHHEYIQVGKGRDVGLNQIALFEAKVSSGNGEQMLSRDVYRLGNLFDFFRMLSFFYTSVGYYICTLMTVWTVYAFLYGRAYLCLSGVEKDIKNRAEILDNAALQSVLNAQFLYQIGIFTAIPMIVCFLLELGVLRAIISFITMQLQLCSVFFTFSLGTRSHYFGRTILHGGAKYRATGRGFVVQHIKFAENYRLYSRSHFVKALEVVMLLIVYVAYGSSKNSLSYILLTFSSWFLALSWLYAPYLFNPSGFEWQKTVDDFDNWTSWLLYKGGVGVKEDESWEKWWDEEQAHLRSLRSRVLETILSLRFFIFQYGVVYHLSAAGGSTSITVYGISWLVFVGLILVMKIFTTSQKSATNLQLFLRLFQGLAFMLILGGVIAAVAATRLTIADLFASGLALIPTGWAILSIAIAWKPIVKFIGLWQPIRSLARLYDAGMGLIIFVPIAILSWFPFVSTFQTRLVFNQAFSRGLEISLILAGNRPNAST